MFTFAQYVADVGAEQFVKCLQRILCRDARVVAITQYLGILTDVENRFTKDLSCLADTMGIGPTCFDQCANCQ